MSLLLEGRRDADWDEVMLQLGRWLTRHLGDPVLPAWVAGRSTGLHPHFADLLRERLAELEQLLADGSQQQLERIVAAAPRAIPGPFERCLWRLLLAGRLPEVAQETRLLDCLAQIRRDGAGASTRMLLRDLLRPCVAPAGMTGETGPQPGWVDRPGRQSWMLVLAGGDPAAAILRAQRDDPAWQQQLPDLLPEFNALLQDARALAGELAAAQAAAEELQSRDNGILVEEQRSPALQVLKELARDAWLATVESDPERAGQVAADQQELLVAAAEEPPARAVSPAPGSRRELVAWLRENPGSEDGADDDWLLRCRADFLISAYALYALAQEGIWPTPRWRDGLRIWAEEEFLGRSWRYVAPVLNDAPDTVLQALAGHLGPWLRATARSLDGHEAIFTGLCHRILLQDYPPPVRPDSDQADTVDPVSQAARHPVGLVTLALLDWWYTTGPVDGAGLPDLLEPVFTALCMDQSEALRHGRVLLAAHAVALYRAAPVWAEAQLLPLLRWQQPTLEAALAWQGFLQAPRVYRPLLPVIGSALLDTAAHYRELGKAGEQYAAFLTLVALERDGAVPGTELATALAQLPVEGLRQSARTLAGALAGAGEQRAEYWRHRVQPCLRELWPPLRPEQLPELADSLAELCTEAGSCFPEALQQLRPWLQAVRFPDHLLQQLQAAGLCRQFPRDSLELMAAVIDDRDRFGPDQLQQCLEAIRQANPELASDHRFVHLWGLTDSRGVA
ncbi:hypothetical protein [Kineobactrum salinum]|uniref:Uncharacterized protein n=1 Tax=Kineobactrum salinum TaxID=2708301 RepID=A0A6C0U280_9GAMM|nr:hypothetical protein [Kineobactrum salinum]QIB65579.1 hypothetical protein G3T16_09345 [Kineobactrum salinum]